MLALLCAFLTPGCGQEGGSSASATDSEIGSPLRIVATTGMVADIAREVGGERVRVETLISPGVDPHLYSPTRSDVQKLLEADIVLYNGLLLEGKMTDALVRAATSGRKVYAVTELLDTSTLLAPEEYEGHHDPHVWMDPSAWVSTIDVVRDALAKADPEGAETYAAAAVSYAEQVAALDAYAERVLATVDEPSRVLITAHDAFNYFGRRFGYEVVGIQGISTESEAGVLDIERLVDLLVERGVGAVFVESTVSDRNVSALIAGARAQGHEVVIGGELFSDAMGPEGTYEGTYIGMIDHNVTTITRALGGDAPEGGKRGE